MILKLQNLKLDRFSQLRDFNTKSVRTFLGLSIKEQKGHIFGDWNEVWATVAFPMGYQYQHLPLILINKK